MAHSAMTALLRRETLAGLRRPAAQVFVALAALVGSTVVIASWPEEGVRLAEAAQSGQFILWAALIALGATAVLLLPVLGALTITAEREKETLELLRLTMIRPTGIVLGKLFNTIAPFLLIVVAFLPILATIFLLPGVDVSQAGTAAALGAACIHLLAAAGVCGSTVARGTVQAVAMAFLLALPILGVSLAILASAVSAQAYYGGIVFVALFMAGIGAGLLLIAKHNLNVPEPVRTPPQTKVIDDPAALEKRRKRYPYYLLDPLKRKPTIGDGVNPVLAREWRWGLFPRLTTAVRLFYLTFVGFGFLCAAYVLDHIGQTGFTVQTAGWLTFQITALALAVPAMVAPMIARDAATGNLDMLRLSLLSSKEVIRGKACAAAMAVAPVLAGMLLGQLPLYLASGTWPYILAGNATLISTLVLLACIALLCSALTSRVLTASVLSYFVAALTLFLAWCMVVFILPVVLDGALPHALVSSLSPPFAYYAAAMSQAYKAPWLPRQGVSHAPHGAPWSYQVYWIYWAASLLIHLALAWVFYAGAVYSYHRSRMRAQS